MRKQLHLLRLLLKQWWNWDICPREEHTGRVSRKAGCWCLTSLLRNQPSRLEEDLFFHGHIPWLRVTCKNYLPKKEQHIMMGAEASLSNWFWRHSLRDGVVKIEFQGMLSRNETPWLWPHIEWLQSIWESRGNDNCTAVHSLWKGTISC